MLVMLVALRSTLLCLFVLPALLSFTLAHPLPYSPSASASYRHRRQEAQLRPPSLFSFRDHQQQVLVKREDLQPPPNDPSTSSSAGLDGRLPTSSSSSPTSPVSLHPQEHLSREPGVGYDARIQEALKRIRLARQSKLAAFFSGLRSRIGPTTTHAGEQDEFLAAEQERESTMQRLQEWKSQLDDRARISPGRSQGAQLTETERQLLYDRRPTFQGLPILAMNGDAATTIKIPMRANLPFYLIGERGAIWKVVPNQQQHHLFAESLVQNQRIQVLKAIDSFPDVRNGLAFSNQKSLIDSASGRTQQGHTPIYDMRPFSTDPEWDLGPLRLQGAVTTAAADGREAPAPSNDDPRASSSSASVSGESTESEASFKTARTHFSEDASEAASSEQGDERIKNAIDRIATGRRMALFSTPETRSAAAGKRERLDMQQWLSDITAKIENRLRSGSNAAVEDLRLSEDEKKLLFGDQFDLIRRYNDGLPILRSFMTLDRSLVVKLVAENRPFYLVGKTGGVWKVENIAGTDTLRAEPVFRDQRAEIHRLAGIPSDRIDDIIPDMRDFTVQSKFHLPSWSIVPYVPSQSATEFGSNLRGKTLADAVQSDDIAESLTDQARISPGASTSASAASPKPRPWNAIYYQNLLSKLRGSDFANRAYYKNLLDKMRAKYIRMRDTMGLWYWDAKFRMSNFFHHRVPEPAEPDHRLPSTAFMNHQFGKIPTKVLTGYVHVRTSVRGWLDKFKPRTRTDEQTFDGAANNDRVDNSFMAKARQRLGRLKTSISYIWTNLKTKFPQVFDRARVVA